MFVIQATYPFTQRAFANRIDAARTVHNTNCRSLPIGWAGRWAELIHPEWAWKQWMHQKSVMIFLVYCCMVKNERRERKSMSVLPRVWAKLQLPFSFTLCPRSICVGRCPIWIWVVDIWRSASVAGVLWTWDTRWPWRWMQCGCEWKGFVSRTACWSSQCWPWLSDVCSASSCAPRTSRSRLVLLSTPCMYKPPKHCKIPPFQRLLQWSQTWSHLVRMTCGFPFLDDFPVLLLLFHPVFNNMVKCIHFYINASTPVLVLSFFPPNILFYTSLNFSENKTSHL